MIAILLSIMIVFTFMPAMAFAADEEQTRGDGAAAILSGVYVTTVDTGDEPNTYDSLAAALDEFNDSDYAEKNVVITICQDETLDASVTFRTPMTIVTNGKTLTVPAGFKNGTDNCASGLCKTLEYEGDVLKKLTINNHDGATTVYHWDKTEAGGYAVTSFTFVCDICGETTTLNVAAEMVNHDSIYTYRQHDNSSQYVFQRRRGSWTYWRGNWYWNNAAGSTWETRATKDVEAPVVGKYTYNDDFKVVYVGDRIQHKDGLPVTKATVHENDNNTDVAAVITLTKATDAEITKAKEDGKLDKDAKNSDATCVDEAHVIYKAVVADPEGTQVDEQYVYDYQAAPTTGHVKGKLEGIQLLVKSSPYWTEAAAIEAAGNDLVRIEKGEDGYYYYWSYGNTISDLEDVNVTDALSADKQSFEYREVYRCLYDFAPQPTHEPLIYSDAVEVKAGPNATTAAEAADGKHSDCTHWHYPKQQITYEYYKTSTDTVKSTIVADVTFVPQDKDESEYSHVQKGSYHEIMDQPTCKEPGTAKINCAVCGTDGVTVPVDKYDDTFAAIPGTATTVTIGTKTATVSADRMTATVAPTCTEEGGVYEYCTGTKNHNTPHYVLKEEIEKTGHRLDVREKDAGDWHTDDPENVFYGTEVSCTACPETVTAVYLAKSGRDYIGDSVVILHDAIEKSGSEVGPNCQTAGKVTYKVKNLQTKTGAAITKEVDGVKGPHSFEAKSFDWSKDYKVATANVKCTVTGCTETDTVKATVTERADASGATVYTATYGDKSDTKKLFSLVDAKVSFDESKLTDGNLIDPPEGSKYTQQVPDVTLTINGVEVDSSSYDVDWTYNSTTKVARATVSWSEAITSNPENIIVPADDPYKEAHVAAKETFAEPTTVVKANDKVVAKTSKRDYDPAVSNSVVTTTTVKGATVKYAVVSEPVETQAEVDALDYNLDAVDGIKAVGKYYVYAQLSAEGYTTYSDFVASIVIDKMTVYASIDNFSMKQGETPSFNVVFTDIDENVVVVDPSEYSVTSAGGQELTALIPGDYKLLVSSENYYVTTEFREGRVGTVTVLTKEGKTADQDAADTAKAADYALADANAVKASNYTAASYARVTKASKALKNAILNGSLDDIKTATENLNKALNSLVKMKKNPMTVKTKTVKAKADKKVKNKVGLVVKNAKGTKTYTKVSGNSKITVNKKTGKFTVKKGLKAGKTYKVKVKVKAAGTKLYKSKTITKTVKVKVS
jgi:hypothetical protein